MNGFDFTDEIQATDIPDVFKTMENWDEKEAKENKKTCCHDCRFFSGGIIGKCSDYVGRYHKTCKDFEWW